LTTVGSKGRYGLCEPVNKRKTVMRPDVLALTLALALPVTAQRGVVSGVSVSKSPAQTGLAVDITVTGTNPCGAVRLDYGDGSERITHPITQIPTTIRYVYRQPGRYEIRAEGMGNCDGVAATSIEMSAPRAEPPSGDRKPHIRFREMDDNGDGVITRAEWRGNARSFRVHDTNRDGILSGEELRMDQEGVVVPATERWTNTGVHVQVGEILNIASTGSVQLSADPSDMAAPGGAPAGRRAPSSPIPSRPAGALIARIGNSLPLFVGNDRTLRAPASGQVYLGVNDDHLADNRGEFRVRIDVERKER
jgi:hypothetical protein